MRKPSHAPIDPNKLSTALITSHMTKMPASMAYDNHDQVQQEFQKRGMEAPLPATIANDIKVGAQSSIFGLAQRHKMPDKLQSPGFFDDLVTGLSEMVADLPVYIAGMVGGGVAGSEVPVVGNVAGAAMGTFAVPAALRKSLTLGIEKGDIKSFGDLLDRTLQTTGAAVKGAATGLVVEATGGATVPLAKALGPAAPIAETAMKGIQQAAALEVAGSLLEGQMPTAAGFAKNAALIGTLGLVAHGLPMAAGRAKQAAMDIYAKDGTLPDATATKLQAQPPVKPEAPAGLQPAIKVKASDGSEQVITGEHDTHSDLAEATTGTRPVTIDELNAAPKEPGVGQSVYINRDIQFSGFDPNKPTEKATYIGDGAEAGFPDRYLLQRVDEEGNPAGKVAVVRHELGLTDKETAASFTGSGQGPKSSPINRVLDQPRTHPQNVIDRAYEIKSATGEPLPLKNTLKSGRGFTNSAGDYLPRNQAKAWVKANEPDVYEQWAKITGDEKAEFHSADYKEARERAAAANVAEGDPKFGVVDEITQYQAKNRSTLNALKAGDLSDGYGATAIRSTFVEPRNAVRAYGEQVASRVEKLIPDYVDQEAISFMRDYRDAPDELRAEIESIKAGDNEKLKQAIPSMERALEPTPAMQQADALMTDYFTQANGLRERFVGTTSSIDPSRYSPRNFMRVEDEEAKGVGTPKFSKRSPHDIRREYLYMLDPLKSGEVEARTFNSVDELRVYGDRLGNSVATSLFQTELANTELGKHGVAGQVPPELKAQMADTGILSAKELEELGAIPKDWVELPGTGKTIISDGKQVHVAFQVPPKVAEAMKPILEKDAISGAKYWKAAKMTQAYIKAIELGLSPFHMRALTLSFMNNAGIDAYRDALASDNNSPKFEAQERKAALYGVTTTKTSTPYEAYRGLKPSSLESRDTLLAKVKESYEPVDKILKGVTTATFDVVQRKFKVIDFSIREAQWLAKHPDATDVEYGKAMRSIAKEVNAVYGGLNWDVMGVSANFQAVARMFLLAPDWTFSNVANLKYATAGGPGGAAARAFWVKSFITGYAMTQAMSLFVTGQTSKHFDKVYLGKDDKGKEMYSSMFFAGAPKDAIGLVNSVMRDGFPTGAIVFTVNKASPLVGTGLKLAENRDWQGKPIVKKGDTGLEKTSKEMSFASENLLPAPFVLKDMAQRYMNPDESLTYKDFLAALVGSPVYHEKPQKQRKTVLRHSILKGSK